jgi:acetoin utilization deacetylase AcuC-like enzyme
VKKGKLKFGHHENDDFNSPELRRNSNLKQILEKNLGKVFGSEAESDLNLAKLVHDEGYASFLENPSACKINKLQKGPQNFSVKLKSKVVAYITDEDLDCITRDLPNILKSDMGVVKKSVNTMLENRYHDVFAMPTHPGHHAGKNTLGGYCFLNNAAIAAKYLLNAGMKVSLVDVDYHGGDGTYHCLDRLEGLRYVSIHAKNDYPEVEMFENGRELPFGTTWKAYSNVLQAVLNSWADVDVVIVSLGFDALASDPLTHDDDGGGFELTPANFYNMGKMFGSMNQQLLFIQEGGYDIENIPNVCSRFLRGVKKGREIKSIKSLNKKIESSLFFTEMSDL